MQHQHQGRPVFFNICWLTSSNWLTRQSGFLLSPFVSCTLNIQRNDFCDLWYSQDYLSKITASWEIIIVKWYLHFIRCIISSFACVRLLFILEKNKVLLFCLKIQWDTNKFRSTIVRKGHVHLERWCITERLLYQGSAFRIYARRSMSQVEESPLAFSGDAVKGIPDLCNNTNASDRPREVTVDLTK